MKNSHLALLYDLAAVPKMPFSVFQKTLMSFVSDHGWGDEDLRASLLWLMLSKVSRVNRPLSKDFPQLLLSELYSSASYVDSGWVRDPEFPSFLSEHFPDLLKAAPSDLDHRNAYDVLCQRMMNDLNLVPLWLPYLPHDVVETTKVNLERADHPISMIHALFYKISNMPPEGASAVASYFSKAGISVYEKVKENRVFLRQICTPELWDMFVQSGGQGTEKISFNGEDPQPVWKQLVRQTSRPDLVQHVHKWAMKHIAEYQKEMGDMFIDDCAQFARRRPRLSDVQQKMCSHPNWYEVQSTKDGTTALMHLITCHDNAHKRVAPAKFASYVAKKDHCGRSVVFYAFCSDTFTLDKMKFLMSKPDVMAPSKTQGGLLMQMALAPSREFTCKSLVDFSKVIQKHEYKMWFSCGEHPPEALFEFFKKPSLLSSTASGMVVALAEKFKEDLKDPLVRGFVLSHMIVRHAIYPKNEGLEEIETFATAMPFAFPGGHSLSFEHVKQSTAFRSRSEALHQAQTMLEKWALYASVPVMPSHSKAGRKI